MFRLVAVIRDAILLAALLAGPPFVLLAVFGSPIPDRWPSASQVQQWADQPLAPPFLGPTAVVIAWLFWAAYATAAVVMAVRRLRTVARQWHRLAQYLPGPAQSLAATVLGAAAVTSAAAPALALPVAATVSSPTPDPDAGLAAGAAGQHKLSPEKADRTDRSQRATSSPTPSAVGPGSDAATHLVRRGDSLYEIADDRLGDGNRWTTIYQLNRGVRAPHHGTALTDPDLIYPGMVLKLPVHASSDTPEARPPITSP
ncbi:LysM peptidoglycan-binding domain-containing protein, partial [Actinoplanes sp. NPDC051633]|uniref:LysM peptidoglycan-binding domain-containing protein n=1 Tax=Actinoplanes sp. NPDC051633 TaxID=3155670 RepID=UPI00344146C0